MRGGYGQEGRTITIGAVTVQPSEKDVTMGFGSRPSGGSVESPTSAQ